MAVMAESKKDAASWHKKNEPGYVTVACWCGLRGMQVPADQVGKTTGSCGRPGCEGPKDIQQ